MQVAKRRGEEELGRKEKSRMQKRKRKGWRGIVSPCPVWWLQSQTSFSQFPPNKEGINVDKVNMTASWPTLFFFFTSVAARGRNTVYFGQVLTSFMWDMYPSQTPLW